MLATRLIVLTRGAISGMLVVLRLVVFCLAGCSLVATTLAAALLTWTSISQCFVLIAELRTLIELVGLEGPQPGLANISS